MIRLFRWGAVQLPTWVATVGAIRVNGLVSQGDSKVYQTAKKAAQLQEPEQIMALVIDHPELCSLPQYSPKEQENAEKQG